MRQCVARISHSFTFRAGQSGVRGELVKSGGGGGHVLSSHLYPGRLGEWAWLPPTAVNRGQVLPGTTCPHGWRLKPKGILEACLDSESRGWAQDPSQEVY